MIPKKPSPGKKSKKASPGEKYSVPNLERALHIMEYVAGCPVGATMSEVATRLKIPRNSAFRILSTLWSHQYVHRDETTQRFRLSGKLLGVACKGTGSDRLLEVSLDILQSLRERTGETALLGRIVDDYGVVLQQVASQHPIQVHVEIGTRFPLHTAAPAKAILAWMPSDRGLQIRKQLKFSKFTNRTATSRTDFEKRLTATRKLGYAVDFGEEVEGIHCVAAPVLDAQGMPVAALWITGPSMRLPKAAFSKVGAHVRECALHLSSRLGYVSSIEQRT